MNNTRREFVSQVAKGSVAVGSLSLIGWAFPQRSQFDYEWRGFAETLHRQALEAFDFGASLPPLFVERYRHENFIIADFADAQSIGRVEKHVADRTRVLKRGRYIEITTPVWRNEEGNVVFAVIVGRSVVDVPNGNVSEYVRLEGSRYLP